ncbi:hypothetical protein B0T10DRAFT_594844 [Thelonectria olida]|uniref:C2H2-type domain-containing protein n=1 Tax=Thelonectria olida TaxID=1576542 RepID=A0A9P9AI56_9HYPO|nr:hypothetical protein B0T10DRAFT_594844 [Thelonectria olida]
MSNLPWSNAAVGSAPSTADHSVSTITTNTKENKPRPHVCGTCQRSFVRLQHLKRHERSHTKEKPFECPKCARCFPRGDMLLRHKQKLHQTLTPLSHSQNCRESASSIVPGQVRARENRVARPNPAALIAPATSMRPPGNTVANVDGSSMQMVATADASVAGGIPRTHSHNGHLSLAGLPIHSLDHDFSGLSAAAGQWGTQHGLVKPETHTLGGLEASNCLQTAPPLVACDMDAEFDFGSVFFEQDLATNLNTLYYIDSPPSMASEQASPFASSWNERPLSQTLDDSSEWFTGFEHAMAFLATENVVDESSPPAITMTIQGGISDVRLDGSNHPSPARTSTIWQPSVMDPLQMPNPVTKDLNGSVFPDLLDRNSLLPPPASRKIDDPDFSTPPPSLNSFAPSVVIPLASTPVRRRPPIHDRTYGL